MKNLTHHQARDWIERLQTGYSPGVDKAALDRHLAGCEMCREYQSDLQAGDAALRQALSEAAPRPAKSPAEFNTIVEQVQGRARLTRFFVLVNQSVRSLSWAVAVLAVVVSINWLFTNFSRGAPEPAAPIPSPPAFTATVTPSIKIATPTSSPDVRYPPVSRQLRMTLTNTGATVNNLSFSPDGTTLAAADSDGAVRIWRVRDGALLTTLDAHDKEATTLAFSPDGSLLATGGKDGTVNIWFARSGAFVRSLLTEEVNVLAIQFSPSGELLAITLSNYSVALVRVSDGKQLETFQNALRLDINEADDSNSYLNASAESAIWLQAGSNLPFNLNIQGQNGKSLDVVLSPSGGFLASASTDGLIYIWRIFDISVTGEDPLSHQPTTIRTITGSLLSTLSGHGGWVNSLDFSADNQYIASGADDGAIMLWSVLEGRAAETLYGHTGPVTAVDISPDDRLIASGSSDGSVRIWSLTDN